MRPLVLATIALVAGCYRYVPDTTPVAAGEVRLSLTPAGAAALAPILGRETVAVEGRIVGASDTLYTMSVSGTLKRAISDDARSPGLTRTVWAGESVTIPRAAVASTDRRTLDRKRTYTALVIGAVSTGLLVRLLVSAVGSGGTESDPGTGVITP